MSVPPLRSSLVYDPVARLLHWLMALALTGLVGLGLYMKSLSLSPLKLQLYSWHKWIGISLLLLALLRLLWRLGHAAPPLPSRLSAGSRRLAKLGHWTLYGLMLAIPLSGWLMSSAKGFQTVWFGVLPLPDLIGKDKALGETLVQVHIFLNYTLMALVVGHVLAALKHHFLDRDPVLGRMLGRLPKE